MPTSQQCTSPSIVTKHHKREKKITIKYYTLKPSPINTTEETLPDRLVALWPKSEQIIYPSSNHTYTE